MTLPNLDALRNCDQITIKNEVSLIPGWFGKIPSIGDFISRRLPVHFIEMWDKWLQTSIAYSHTQLGEQYWLKLYLVSPIWRFILLPGICGNSLWTGILMPSIDRVGRHFPLTIALPLEPHADCLFTALSAQHWYKSVENQALTVLNIDTMPEDFDMKLINHLFPSCNQSESNLKSDLANWLQNSSQSPIVCGLPNSYSLVKQFEGVAEEALLNLSQGKSIWWTVDSKREDNQNTDQLICFTGLPPVNYFSVLLGHQTL